MLISWGGGGGEKKICPVELVLRNFSPENAMKKCGFYFFSLLIHLD